MTLKFYKYQGTGNDFIMVDNRLHAFNNPGQKLVKNLCDRRIGIGADGLILLEDHPESDFQMIYFNADGRQGSMCGNGGRCIVQFAHDLGAIKSETTFLAVDGEHDAYLKNELIHLKMSDVSDVEKDGDSFFLNTGSPHYVSFVENIHQFPVLAEGKKIRNNERFSKEGTNVNFINRSGDNLWVRTFERGVEDETYSCGTGVTAAALCASLRGMESPVSVTTLGGELKVSFEKSAESFQNIYLIGPAKRVFEGSIQL